MEQEVVGGSHVWAAVFFCPSSSVSVWWVKHLVCQMNSQSLCAVKLVGILSCKLHMLEVPQQLLEVFLARMITSLFREKGN